MNLDQLLRPNRICIIGASEKDGFGGDTCRNAFQYMDDSLVYLVNPRRSQCFGRPVYPTIADVPEQFDLAIICTPMSTVEDLMRQAKAKGAGAAVVYASGYKEVGTKEGLEAQNHLIAVAKELDMAVMGPNCAGFINYADARYAFAFISEERDRRGHVGFVSQSGQLCLSMMESPATSFSYCISAGNAAVTSMEQYIDFLVDDADTKVVALYLEGLKNIPLFVSALRKAARMRKPVVILKAGRSEKGSRVAASHTGSMAGSDRVFDALCRKFGVIRVDDLEELIYTAQMLATMPRLPKGGRIGSMNLSGGETGICADVGSQFGLDYPDFAPPTLEKLRTLLPAYASPANPLDMTATLSYDVDKYAEALQTVMQDPSVDLVMIGYTLLEKISDTAIYYMTEAIERVAAMPDAKPMVMLPFAGNTRNPEYQKRLEACGVCVLPAPCYGLKILKNLEKFVSYDPDRVDTTLAIPTRAKGTDRISLSEHDAKMLLAGSGIPVPPEAVVSSREKAWEVAEQIGYPMAMKISSPDILHKSDCGGVILGIKTREEAEKAYDRILINVQKKHPQAQIEGILCQKMAQPGTEMIVGVFSDPQIGPAILVGMGGIFVEVFRDTAMALAPISVQEAEEMILSLKSAKLLQGVRGQKPCDISALAELLVRVSRFAAEHRDCLLELDLNPVFVNENGVAAVDAVVISDEPIR